MSKKLPVASPNAIAYKPSKADIERERDYRAQSDIETLKKADEIRKDKDRVKDCKQYAKKQIKALGKI